MDCFAKVSTSLYGCWPGHIWTKIPDCPKQCTIGLWLIKDKGKSKLGQFPRYRFMTGLMAICHWNVRHGCQRITPRRRHRPCQHWLGNGLLPNPTRSLPEPMVIHRQMCPVAFTWEKFHKCTWIYFITCCKDMIYLSKNLFILMRLGKCIMNYVITLYKLYNHSV